VLDEAAALEVREEPVELLVAREVAGAALARDLD
jgi:hypothetical protein